MILEHFEKNPNLGWQSLPEDVRNDFLKGEQRELVEQLFVHAHEELFPEKYAKTPKPKATRGKRA